MKLDNSSIYPEVCILPLKKVFLQMSVYLTNNLFQATGLFLYPLKKSENLYGFLMLWGGGGVKKETSDTKWVSITKK